MYIGIDPSLSHTGVVALSAKFELVRKRVVTSESVKDWKMQVVRVENMLSGLARCFAYEMWIHIIDAVVLEGYSYGSRFQSHQLGELGFAYRQYLYHQYAERSYVVPPKTVKKFITGNGNANKRLVADCISRDYSLEFDTEDLSDACAMALFGAGIINPEKFTEEQQKVVKEWFGGNQQVKLN